MVCNTFSFQKKMCCAKFTTTHLLFKNIVLHTYFITIQFFFKMWKLVRMTFSYEKNVLWREDLSPESPIHARTFHWPRRWVQRLNWSIRPVHTPRDVARIAAVCLALALYGQTFDRFHKAEFSLSKWEFPVALCRPRFCLAMLCISAAYAVMRCLSVCLLVRHVLGLCRNE